MVPKSFIVLGLVLAVVLLISSEVAAKDLETANEIEDDRGFNNGGGRGGNGGFNNGGGRGGNGGFNNGGGRGGNGGFNNGGGRGGNGGFNGGGRGGNNGRRCRYDVCCNRRGYCQCCYSAAQATAEAKP